jgi:uncharacterized protein (DUF983 family)
MEGPQASAWMSGLRRRCPRCGRGRLFSGFLSIAGRCEVCGLDYSFSDAGDGPAVFIILVAGFVITGGALVTEVMFSPPYSLHALIWLPLGIALPLLLLRPFKATLVALQYRNDAREGRLE